MWISLLKIFGAAFLVLSSTEGVGAANNNRAVVTLQLSKPSWPSCELFEDTDTVTFEIASASDIRKWKSDVSVCDPNDGPVKVGFYQANTTMNWLKQLLNFVTKESIDFISMLVVNPSVSNTKLIDAFRQAIKATDCYMAIRILPNTNLVEMASWYAMVINKMSLDQYPSIEFISNCKNVECYLEKSNDIVGNLTAASTAIHKADALNLVKPVLNANDLNPQKAFQLFQRRYDELIIGRLGFILNEGNKTTHQLIEIVNALKGDNPNPSPEPPPFMFWATVGPYLAMGAAVLILAGCVYLNYKKLKNCVNCCRKPGENQPLLPS